VSESIAFEALHATSFMVHTNEQILSDALDLLAQLRQLLPGVPIAREQNNAPTQRMAQALFIHLGQLQAIDVEQDGGVMRKLFFHENYGIKE